VESRKQATGNCGHACILQFRRHVPACGSFGQQDDRRAAEPPSLDRSERGRPHVTRTALEVLRTMLRGLRCEPGIFQVRSGRGSNRRPGDTVCSLVTVEDGTPGQTARRLQSPQNPQKCVRACTRQKSLAVGFHTDGHYCGTSGRLSLATRNRSNGSSSAALSRSEWHKRTRASRVTRLPHRRSVRV
jgi:hypothetical protein